MSWWRAWEAISSMIWGSFKTSLQSLWHPSRYEGASRSLFLITWWLLWWPGRMKGTGRTLHSASGFSRNMHPGHLRLNVRSQASMRPPHGENPQRDQRRSSQQCWLLACWVFQPCTRGRRRMLSRCPLGSDHLRDQRENYQAKPPTPEILSQINDHITA